MTTDRELLELAATAAGYEYGEINGAFKARIEQDVGTCGTYGCQKHQWRDWNPLTDDGDALRLAVRLRLLISLHERFEVHVVWWRNGERGEIRETDKDSYVATRRAIVRAAAEIGRQHD